MTVKQGLEQGMLDEGMRVKINYKNQMPESIVLTKKETCCVKQTIKRKAGNFILLKDENKVYAVLKDGSICLTLSGKAEGRVQLLNKVCKTLFEGESLTKAQYELWKNYLGFPNEH